MTDETISCTEVPSENTIEAYRDAMKEILKELYRRIDVAEAENKTLRERLATTESDIGRLVKFCMSNEERAIDICKNVVVVARSVQMDLVADALTGQMSKSAH